MRLFRNRLVIHSILTIPFLGSAGIAGVIQPDAILPPTSGAYRISDTCVLLVCVEDIAVRNFDTFESTIVSDGQLTKSKVELHAKLFGNVNGSPGAFLGLVLLIGQIDIAYLGRDSLYQLGTFGTEVTFLSLKGVLPGPHTVEAQLNPLKTSKGTTTVVATPAGFDVTSTLEVFAQLKVDGGPFMPGPPRIPQLTPIPEPGSAGLIVLGGMIPLVVVIRRR